MPKHHADTNASPECPREPMGLDPSVLAKRVPRPYAWCPVSEKSYSRKGIRYQSVKILHTFPMKWYVNKYSVYKQRYTE